MKCEQCGKEIVEGEYFTAVGIVICPKCNEENRGSISMDFIFGKIEKEAKKEKELL